MLLTFEWRKQKTDSVVINIHPSLVYSPHLSHFSWAERESWAVCVYTGLAFSATFIQLYKLFCVLSPWLSNCIILGIGQLDKNRIRNKYGKFCPMPKFIYVFWYPTTPQNNEIKDEEFVIQPYATINSL